MDSPHNSKGNSRDAIGVQEEDFLVKPSQTMSRFRASGAQKERAEELVNEVEALKTLQRRRNTGASPPQSFPEASKQARIWLGTN